LTDKNVGHRINDRIDTMSNKQSGHSFSRRFSNYFKGLKILNELKNKTAVNSDHHDHERPCTSSTKQPVKRKFIKVSPLLMNIEL
jgi:hypothetical protein